MKALVLVRTGKEEEAFELCNQVKKTIPTDEATLQALTMTLKELGKRKRYSFESSCTEHENLKISNF